MKCNHSFAPHPEADVTPSGLHRKWKCKRCGEVKDLYNVPLLNLEKIKVGPGRPYKLFTCNTCGKVMGSAEVRKHKCQK